MVQDRAIVTTTEQYKVLESRIWSID